MPASEIQRNGHVRNFSKFGQFYVFRYCVPSKGADLWISKTTFNS